MSKTNFSPEPAPIKSRIKCAKDAAPYVHPSSAAACVYQKSDSAILVMKTTENRSRCDNAEALNRARERGIFAQRAMNS